MQFADEKNVFNGTKSEDMIKASKVLETATSACIVGTGSVGIEIAGEIIAKYPKVKLTIISSSELFLERSVPDAHKNVLDYFSSFPKEQVRLIMGERLQSYKDGIVSTEKGSAEVKIIIYILYNFKNINIKITIF